MKDQVINVCWQKCLFWHPSEEHDIDQCIDKILLTDKTAIKERSKVGQSCILFLKKKFADLNMISTNDLYSEIWF